MEIKKLHLLFFTPTHTTRDCLRNIAKGIVSDGTIKDVEFHNLTLPPAREKEIEIPEDELLLVGMPVYAGRVPGMFQAGLPVKGRGAAVCAVVYGNRDYDDALIELVSLTSASGFRVAAAGAFIAQHSLNPLMAAGRPDYRDAQAQMGFGKDILRKIGECDAPGDIATVGVRGNSDYKPYSPAMLVPQLIADKCISCRICAGACPTQVISHDDFTVVDPAGCIMCNACVTFCPRKARDLPEPQKSLFGEKMRKLQEANSMRKEPELFI